MEPSVGTIGYLAFDDRFIYAVFEFLDPNPAAIRAPLTDRDRIFGNGPDFGGLFLDTRNDGHSAVELLVTASGVQYDAVTDDATGEDGSPDFFWDSATERGWTLEMRVPFSTLRYRNVNPQTWASCSTETTRASSGTRSRARHCRGAATVRSASSTTSWGTTVSPRPSTSSPRRLSARRAYPARSTVPDHRDDELMPSSRQFFTKVSYAFQR